MSKKHQGRQPSPIPMPPSSEVPVHDFFEDTDLADPYSVDEALRNFINDLRSGYFLAWEAVICQEEGLPLTKKQKQALRELVNFGAGEDDDGPIFYIDGIPRPNTQWYEIARTILPCLVDIEPLDTLKGGREGIFEGWPDLLDAFDEHALNLSLPDGVERPIDIVPIELVHQLNLQYCLDMLSGLGQDAELTLDNEEQQERIVWLVDELREQKGMVRYFDLSLNRFLHKVRLPAKEETLFRSMMSQALDLPSHDAPLINFLCR